MTEVKPMETTTSKQEKKFNHLPVARFVIDTLKKMMKKVRDHCISQANTEALRMQCNLDYSFRYFKLPVFLHNLKNCDGHLMISMANEMNDLFKYF